jgi:hypothetical protein
MVFIKKTATVPPNSINRLGCVGERQCVSYGVRTEALYVTFSSYSSHNKYSPFPQTAHLLVAFCSADSTIILPILSIHRGDYENGSLLELDAVQSGINSLMFYKNALFSTFIQKKNKTKDKLNIV